MVYRHEQPVMFQHCDPAGIVFYPRYFEMLNATVETWFEALGFPFARILGPMALGVPTVATAATFHAPSRLGERLGFALEVERVGRTSLALALGADCAGERRLSATATLVCVAAGSGRPVPWPDPLRAAFTPGRADAAPDHPS